MQYRLNLLKPVTFAVENYFQNFEKKKQIS